MVPFPEHAAIIGDILIAYGELEFVTLELIAHALGNAADEVPQALPILYRLRGANDRLNVAEATLRPFMARMKLIGPFGHWLGAMRRCRIIRNQYAHCTWGPQTDRLWFANLDEAAHSAEGEISLNYLPVDLALLKEQQAYFAHTMKLTAYLTGEAFYRTDRRRTKHRRPLPKSRAAPKLHSPPD